jgi:hypothetical protein
MRLTGRSLRHLCSGRPTRRDPLDSHTVDGVLVTNAYR